MSSRKKAAVGKEPFRRNIYFEEDDIEFLEAQGPKEGLPSVSDFVRWIVRAYKVGELVRAREAKAEADALREMLNRILGVLQDALAGRSAPPLGPGEKLRNQIVHEGGPSSGGQRE